MLIQILNSGQLAVHLAFHSTHHTEIIIIIIIRAKVKCLIKFARHNLDSINSNHYKSLPDQKDLTNTEYRKVLGT